MPLGWTGEWIPQHTLGCDPGGRTLRGSGDRGFLRAAFGARQIVCCTSRTSAGMYAVDDQSSRHQDKHSMSISWDVCHRQPVITSPRPAHHEHQLACMHQYTRIMSISWGVCGSRAVIEQPRQAHHEHQLRCMLQPGNHRPAITPSRPARHEGRTLHTARHSATKTPAATASAAMHGANGPSSTHRDTCIMNISSAVCWDVAMPYM